MRFLLLVLVGLFHLPAYAADIVVGPIEAIVEKVRDGDTFEAVAMPWPGHRVPVAVRIVDIDTPEINGKCAEEKRLAKAAKARVQNLIGQKVQLYGVRGDKYFGRVLARVQTSDGKDLGKILLNERHARPYSGRKRHDWCS